MRLLSSMEENNYTVKLFNVLHNSNWNSERQHLFLVMNYIEQDLGILLKKKPDNFDQNHLNTLVYNLLCAINFIHSANIIHRDLKPNNILFTENCRIVICDFG